MPFEYISTQCPPETNGTPPGHLHQMNKEWQGTLKGVISNWHSKALLIGAGGVRRNPAPAAPHFTIILRKALCFRGIFFFLVSKMLREKLCKLKTILVLVSFVLLGNRQRWHCQLWIHLCTTTSECLMANKNGKDRKKTNRQSRS